MPSSANGAPLHFEDIHDSTRNHTAQSFSAGLHFLILVLLLFAVASVPSRAPRDSTLLGPAHALVPYIPRSDSTGTPSQGRQGGGGEQDKKPSRAGNLPPFSPMPLAPPRIHHNENPELPVPPSVLDANAPENISTVRNVGLPWMKLDTDSAGPGKDHGFGSGNGSTIGDGNRSGAGEAEDGVYSAAVTQVTCVYCPQPAYSEEARKAKLQGRLLLHVLVGVDGRAQRIQLLEGLGLGLDERAVEAVRNWRFSPARDASKQPIPAWVTVETRFQLF